MSTNQSKRELLRQKRAEQKRRTVITIIIIVLVAGALFTLAAFLPKILMEQAKFSGGEGFTIGDKNAPIAVVQFSSYSCGFCRDFSTNQEPDFIKNYVDTGQVFYRYVNIPSNDAASQLASKASYCAADQNGFFQYRPFLYENVSSPDGFSEASLVNYASLAGLNTENFQKCMGGTAYTTAFMDDIQYAQNIGLTYTPAFLIGDQLVGASELVPTVEELLDQ